MKRNSVIDIIKGIGIILMVLGHSGFPLTHFIYLFHMPIFFMASGYLFHPEKVDNITSLKSYIIKKIKSLYLPFVFWNCIFILLNNTFIRIHIYATDKIVNEYPSVSFAKSYFYTVHDIFREVIKVCFFVEGTALGGALWFLRILFMVSVCFAIVEYILQCLKVRNQILIQFFLSCILSILGYMLQQKNVPNTTSIALLCSVYILFYMGYLFRRIIESSEWVKKTHIHIFLFIVSVSGLICFNSQGSIDLAECIYPSPLFLLFTSILGWIFLWTFSRFIKKFNTIKDIFVYIGQNTMPIIILNFICFKPVTFIAICMKNLSFDFLGAYPVLYSNGMWWLFYSIAGLGLPLFFYEATTFLKQKREVCE